MKQTLVGILYIIEFMVVLAGLGWLAKEFVQLIF